MPPQLAEAAEAIAAELLRRGKHPQGISMRSLAQRLSIAVVEHTIPGLLGGALRSNRVILLSPSGCGPRDEFTLAHEIAELHIPADWHDVLPEEVKERACNRVAAALLLPPAPFLYALQRSDWSLPELRKRFPLVSYEALATRIVDLTPGATAASWLDGKRSWWRGPKIGADVAPFIRAENAALRLAHRGGCGVIKQGGIVARAWRLTAKGKHVALTVCSLVQ